MTEVRNGNYGMYKGKLYRIGQTYKDSVHLCSINRDDLNNEFICNYTKTQTEYYGFICIKDVPKSEITEAYEIKTHAFYKGITYSIIGVENGTNLLTLAAPCEIPLHPTGEMLEIKNNLVEMGFYVYIADKFGLTYAKDVSIDDPELKIIEERTEIDINKL